MKYFIFFIIGYFVFFVFALLGMLFEKYLAKKSNYNCSKCKNSMCTARFCEQKRGKK